MSVILTNFSWGNGPYCRAVQLACKIADQSDHIVVPLVYGERQKKILSEELSKNDLSKIYFDDKAGQLLRQLFFNGKNYNQFLSHLTQNISKIKDKLQDHYTGSIAVHDFHEKIKKISYPDISICVGRNSLFPFLPKREVTTSFATHAGLFEACTQDPHFHNQHELFQAATGLFKKYQKEFSLTLLGTPCIDIPVPQIFKSVPPLVEQPLETNIPPKKANIYVTISGLDQLQIPYKNLNDNPHLVLSKSIGQYQGPIGPPNLLHHPQITAHWARPSWNAIWAMVTTGKPLFCLPSSYDDDPEIYWNIKTLKKLNLYAEPGQPFSLDTLNNLRRNIMEKFKTLNGLDFCAKIIRKHFRMSDH